MADHDFFISYSSKNSEFVERLYDDLKKNGFAVWRDKNEIRATDDWAKAIDNALRSITNMIVVISKESMISDEVYREWTFFLSRGKRLICVWLEDTDEIPYRLDPQQRIDFRSHSDYNASLIRLTKELELLLEQGAVSEKTKRETRESKRLIAWEDIRRVSSLFTQKMLDVRYTEKFDPAYYLPRKGLRTHFDRFLQSEKTVMVVTGKAGTGKSSFVCSLNEDKPQTLLIVLQDCAHLELEPETNIEDYLAQVLGIHSHLISTLGTLYKDDPSYKVLFLFDAVNEFKERELLLSKISDFIKKIDTAAIKVLITSRIPIWHSIKRALAVPVDVEFHTSGSNSIVNIDAFEDDELSSVYQLYQNRYNFQRPFIELSEQVKNFLKQPLFMKLTAEAYTDQVLPRTLVLKEVFTKYVESCLGERGFESDEYIILERAIEIMFANAQRELKLSELVSDKIVGDKIVSQAYDHLVDAGIISQRGQDKSLLRSVQMVFVTYERVFEFLLADITVGNVTVERIEEYLDLAKSKSFVQLRGALELAVGFSIIHDNRGIATILELAHRNRPDTRQFLVDVIQVVFESGNQTLASDIVDELNDDDDDDFGLYSKLLAAQAAYQLRFDDKLVKSALSDAKDLRDIASIFIYLRWNQARLSGHLQDGYKPIRQLANSINLFRPKHAVRAISAFITLAITIVPHAIEDTSAVAPLVEISQQIVRQVPGLEPKPSRSGLMTFVGNNLVKIVAQALFIVSKNLTSASVFDDEGTMESFFEDGQSQRAFVDCNLLMDRESLVGCEEIITRLTNWEHSYVYWLIRFPLLYHMTHNPDDHEDMMTKLFDDDRTFTTKGRANFAWAMTYGYVNRIMQGNEIPVTSFNRLKDNFIKLWYEVEEESPTGYAEGSAVPENHLRNILYGLLIIEVLNQKRIGNVTGSDFVAELIALPDVDFNTKKVQFLLSGLEQVAYFGYPDFTTITVLGSRFRSLWQRKAYGDCVSMLANLRAFYQEEIDSLIISDEPNSENNKLWNQIRITGTRPEKSKVFSASAVLWPLLDATTPAFLKITSAIGFDLCLSRSIPELFERTAQSLISSIFDIDIIHILYYLWYKSHDPDWAKFERFELPEYVADPSFRPDIRLYYQQLIDRFIQENGKGQVAP